MSIIGSNILAGSSGQATGYNINNSLRFRSSASAYLSRTPASNGNQQIFTWSGWVKRGQLSSEQAIIVCRTGSNAAFGRLVFSSGDVLQFFARNSSSVTTALLNTTQVFRDPSAWYHIVLAVDTTQATAANRIKFYVNGTEITAFSTATYPSQNTNLDFNTTADTYIGVEIPNANYFDGYMAEVNFVNAQQLTPSSFGETSTTTGSWIPKKYTSTYGTNGFYLTFADTSAATAAAIGKDSSGNGNNWTPSGISVTAGTTYDAMIDSPTLTSTTVANYATFNPLKMPAPASVSYTNGNLSVSCATANQTPALATIYPSSGKWYWEVIWTSGTYARIGVQNTTVASTDFAADSAGWRWENNTGNIYNGSTLATVSTYATNDVLGFCLDCDAGKFYVSKNGTWQNSAVPESGTGAVATNIPTSTLMSPAVATGSLTSVFAFNAGQRPFAYTPPTGFVRLNTFNLPDSTIKKGNTVMDATLYTGNGASRTVTNAGSFKTDLVWVKSRSNAATWHILADSVRGAGYQLSSNQTNAEIYDAQGVGFASNGFTLGADIVDAYYGWNLNGDTYVGWQWQAGQGSTSSNTNGSITSTVSASTTAGFSIVTYTGTGANATVGHGLGVAPKWVVVKRRNGGGTENWMVYHAAVTTPNANPGNNRMLLNLTNASNTDSAIWNNTNPTSSVFSIGTSSEVNANTGTYVAYCWAEIAGFSKFGSYTGNGVNGDGPFVFCGFRPKFVLFKNTNTTQDWIIMDTARDTKNKMTQWLSANTSGAEYTDANIAVDFVSNGFKIRTSIGTELNGNGNTIIFMAFAENPFKNANAR